MAFAVKAEDANTLIDKGNRAFSENNFEEALKAYSKADSIFLVQNSADTPEWAQCRHDMGRCYLSKGDCENARIVIWQALDMRRRLFGEVSQQYISSLNNFALSYFQEGGYDKAIEMQLRVVELLDKLPSPHPADNMFRINLGRSYYLADRYAEAKTVFEAELPRTEKFSPAYELVLNILGNIYQESDDMDGMSRIMALMQEHNEHELTKPCDEPGCMLERAEYYVSSNNEPSAKDCFNRLFAMDLTDRQKLEAYRLYARYQFIVHDFLKGADYWLMAHELMNKLGEPDTNRASVCCSAGMYYFIGKEYDRAISTLNPALSYCTTSEFDKTRLTSLQTLGNSYSAKKDYGPAKGYYNEALKLLEAKGQTGTADYAKLTERLAVAEKFNEDYQDSKAHYQRAIELYAGLGDVENQQSAMAGLHTCLLYMGEDPGAEEVPDIAREAQRKKLRKMIDDELSILELTRTYFGELSYAESLGLIAGCHEMLGEYDDAIDYYSMFLPTLRTGLAKDFLLKGAAEREIAWNNTLTRMYNLYDMLGRENFIGQEKADSIATLFYDAQLLSKGILLTSAVEFEKVVKRYGDPETVALAARVKENGDRLEAMRSRIATEADLNEYLQAQRVNDELQLDLLRRCAQVSDYTHSLSISHEDILNSLGDNDLAVEFMIPETEILPNDQPIYALLLSRKNPEGKTLKIGKVADFNKIIVDSARYTNDVHGQWLWGEILKYAPEGGNIYFAPDGVLNNFGIEYLSVNGCSLNQQRSLRRLSSTREICLNHGQESPGSIELYGDIDYDDDELDDEAKALYNSESNSGLQFQYLMNARDEIDAIANVARGSLGEGVAMFDMTNATKGNFLSASDRQANILHIATHGEYIADKNSTEKGAMRNSVLAFAGANLYTDHLKNPGIVNALEIAGMSLQDCGLAVLSACKSGIGLVGNDGVFGLQRGFKNAGVKSLLVSLNEVVDSSTAAIMVDFYTNYFAGKSKSESLRLAQQKARAENPDDDTWASFILIDAL